MQRFFIAVCLSLFAVATFAKEPAARLKWEVKTGTHLPQAMLCDEKGEYLFAAIKTGGVLVLDVRGSKSPRVAATIPVAKMAGLDAMNLALSGDRLYVALGDFFAPANHAGLAILDVSAPAKPELLGVWKSPKPMKGAAVVAVLNETAFLGAMNFGVMSFNVKTPTKIKHLTTFLPDIHFPKRNPNAVQHPNARGMAVRGELLFVAYDAGGLRVLNVRDPSKPREVGRYINAGMKGKQQAYNNVLLSGSRALAAIDYAGFEAIDISRPTSMKQIGWWNPWKAETLQNLWFNSPGHTNQLVLDSTGKNVLLSAGDSEMLMLNIARPSRPTLAIQYGKSKNDLGVWGLTMHGKTVYLGYITTVVPFRGTWTGIKAVTLP